MSSLGTRVARDTHTLHTWPWEINMPRGNIQACHLATQQRHSATWQVDFEVNLVIQFVDGYMITENFPVRLYR